MMGPKSARSTALYQTEAFSSTVTSPTRTAVAAMNADGCTTGDFPSKLHSGMGRALAVFSESSPILPDSPSPMEARMRTPRIAAVATATPSRRFTQAELLAIFGYEDAQRRSFFE